MLHEGNNSIKLTLCGHPQPKLSFTFRGQPKKAEMIEKVGDSKKMYKYRINLDNVNREDNGSPLKFNAVGFKAVSYTHLTLPTILRV